MKKIALMVALFGINGMAFAENPFDLVSSTFVYSEISVLTGPTLVSLSPALRGTSERFSVSLYNVGSLTAAYVLSGSSIAAVPTLTCSNGVPIGTGTTAAPYVVNEKFHGLYMWAISCGGAAITTFRRAIRGL